MTPNLTPSMQRDPRIDPRPGDVFKVDRDIMTVVTREFRRPNQIEYGLGNAKEYVRYRLKSHPGFQGIQAVSGFRKRIKNAEVIEAALAPASPAAAAAPSEGAKFEEGS